MSNVKASAVAAYDAACAMPASADWRSVADMLRAALAGRSTAATGFPAWWADYALPKHYTADSVDVLFHDGETVRANVFQAAKKPARIAATIRTAIAFYRSRTGLEAVPAIASVTRVSDGATFDAAACTELTAALRSKDGARIEAGGARAITSDSIARMTAELERRRGGLARLLADVEAARAETVPLCLSLTAINQAEFKLKQRIARAADAPAWDAAIAAGEAELAAMHAAYGAIEAAPAAEAVPLDADDIAAALALPYGDAPEAEIGGTVEAEPVRDSAAHAPRTLFCRNACADAPIEQPGPVEAIEAAPADEWRPSAATHPIVALCLSDKAREALEARVLDGTWRAAGRDAAGGAWRLTLEDARACADIPSLRLVGMPRKPRRPRVAPPVKAIAAPCPVEAIASLPAYMVPAGARPIGPVTFHSAPVA